MDYLVGLGRGEERKRLETRGREKKCNVRVENKRDHWVAGLSPVYLNMWLLDLQASDDFDLISYHPYPILTPNKKLHSTVDGIFLFS